jgi:hypothetical protein
MKRRFAGLGFDVILNAVKDLLFALTKKATADPSPCSG